MVGDHCVGPNAFHGIRDTATDHGRPVTARGLNRVVYRGLRDGGSGGVVDEEDFGALGTDLDTIPDGVLSFGPSLHDRMGFSKAVAGAKIVKHIEIFGSRDKHDMVDRVRLFESHPGIRDEGSLFDLHEELIDVRPHADPSTCGDNDSGYHALIRGILSAPSRHFLKSSSEVAFCSDIQEALARQIPIKETAKNPRMNRLCSLGVCVGLAFAPGSFADEATQVERAIEVLLEAENSSAASAWKGLVDSGVSALLPTLDSIGEGGALADNWLRSAINAMVEASDSLPLSQLTAFALDASNHDAAREIAFRLFQGERPEVAAKLIPGFLGDSSLALRRLAVGRVLSLGAGAEERGDSEAATAYFQQALSAARDVDQIELASAKLEDLGQPVDLPSRFGFLTNWRMVGPFDNTGGAGFETAFGPENDWSAEARYSGKEGAVEWIDYSSSDKFGIINFNDALGAKKAVVGYAATDFYTDEPRSAELRLGCKNAWKIWLNGEFVFGRDEYHRGMKIDQYILPVRLRAGKNEILVKACQNEEREEWTVEWEFQLRICDSSGAAIHSSEDAL